VTLTAEPVSFTARRPTPGISPRGPQLLPLEAGEQYRFTFAMDACIGCHSCEVACAEQNDRPVDEAWRKVGEVEGGDFPDTRRYNISMACNHCVEPTCLSGCPTNAYEKLGNGIVTHHPDECIGCQYCQWNCPYEVPVFDKVRRIVSKCDMCKPRIDQGQSPACVLACPTSAIGIEPVDIAAWRDDHSEADAPGLPPSGITLSTTRVVVPPGVPEGTVAANAHRVEPEDPHWPLVALTLLTQLSLGSVAATVVLQVVGASRGPGGVGGHRTLAGAALGAFLAGAVALSASLLHLGRPGRALKALRNLRTSWLSREVALFSAFSLLSFVYAASWSGRGASGSAAGLAAGLVAAVIGVAGVYASARLYLVPARPVWNSRRTPTAFFATAASTGPLLALVCLDRTQVRPAWIAVLVAVSVAGAVVQLAVLAHLVRTTRRRHDAQHQGTAQLLADRFQVLCQLRVITALLGATLLASIASVPLAGPAAAGRLEVALVLLSLGEVAGRYLFYVTVVPYRVAGSFSRRR